MRNRKTNRLETIRRALRRWDPIGVIRSLEAGGFPPDEYDSYAPRVLKLVESGATGREIAIRLAHLTSLPTNRQEHLMNLYWRDVRKPYEPPFDLRYLIAVLRPIARIPVVRKYLWGTVAGMVGRIDGEMKRGRYADAYEIALQGLTRFRDPDSSFMSRDIWWFFMKLAVDCLEQLPPSESRESLMLSSRNGPEPFEGYYVAYPYSAFARWRYADRRYDEGTGLATVASSADPTWGVPDLQIGLSQLASGIGYGYEHFIRAVTKDPEIVHELLANPAIRGRRNLLGMLEASPEIQAALRDSSGPGGAR